LYALLRASESVGRELTNQFYALYADIRQRVLSRLCRENSTIAPQEILRCILHALYDSSNARLEELRGQRTLFDLDRQILQHNLYGVDLNAEAIQICQLSLRIKTAARGKRLTSLDHTIREGNSIISDKAVHPKAFDWQAAFPEVFAQGGVLNVAAAGCWAGEAGGVIGNEPIPDASVAAPGPGVGAERAP
jgi:hypothetical protein